MAGVFLTFEGPEGAGKTTQTEKLVAFLQDRGIETVITREPGGTAYGQKIRRLLLDKNEEEIHDLTELLLFSADRAQHVAMKVRPALAAGHWVISDRYVDSFIAYQGYGRGLDRNLLEELTRIATAGLRPDLTVLIDVEYGVGFRRVEDRTRKTVNLEKDRLETAGVEFHQRVRQGFLELASREPERFLIVPGDRSVDEIHRQIIAGIQERGLFDRG